MSAYKQILKMAERNEIRFSISEIHPADVAMIQSTWPEFQSDVLRPDLHIFRWEDSGVVLDDRGVAEYPEFSTPDLIDSVAYPVPYEKLWLEIPVANAASGKLLHYCWIVDRTDDGFMSRFIVLRDGVIVDNGLRIGLKRHEIDDDGIPKFTFGAPTSVHKWLDPVECRDLQQLVLRFFRLLCLEKVSVDALVPDERLNIARAKRGRRPLPVQHIVRIKHEQTNRCDATVGVDRASPKPHHRRRHFRNLRNGRRVEVREAIVRGSGILPRAQNYVV